MFKKAAQKLPKQKVAKPIFTATGKEWKGELRSVKECKSEKRSVTEG